MECNQLRNREIKITDNSYKNVTKCEKSCVKKSRLVGFAQKTVMRDDGERVGIVCRAKA